MKKTSTIFFIIISLFTINSSVYSAELSNSEINELWEEFLNEPTGLAETTKHDINNPKLNYSITSERENLCKKIIDVVFKDSKEVVKQATKIAFDLNKTTPEETGIDVNAIIEETLQIRIEATLQKLIESELTPEELQVIYDTRTNKLVSKYTKSLSLAIIKANRRMTKPIVRKKHLKKVKKVKLTKAEEKVLQETDYKKISAALKEEHSYLNEKDLKNANNMIINEIVSQVREDLTDEQVLYVADLITKKELIKFDKIIQ